MPRRRWRTLGRREPLSTAMRLLLERGPEAVVEEKGQGPEDYFAIRFDEPRRQDAAWEEHGEEILRGWIEERPGTRPAYWWGHVAPEPRQRLGGIGTPAHEVLAYAPTFRFGIPIYWVLPWCVEYYNGRARDVHGKPIGTEFKDGQFTGQAIDPDDPPRYESEAAYLDRHRLLTAEERAALPEDAFEPEVVLPTTDDEEGA